MNSFSSVKKMNLTADDGDLRSSVVGYEQTDTCCVSQGSVMTFIRTGG